jgi:CRISPR/Cas system CSM-associated protein Csm3 (group 7 of RAMP superfamily)
MLIRGHLIAESPLYRGNARKTLFTRDGDGTQRLISLAGEISGTAQALMDAFVGQSRDGKNIGLLQRLWQRLYGGPMPAGLISHVQCDLQNACYPQGHFFDLRMGIRLDEDRWAVDANANYKMETVFRNAVFDFTLSAHDGALRDPETTARLYYLLQELAAGRFWFGMGKSTGLGQIRLVWEAPWPTPTVLPALRPGANHLRLGLSFTAENPVLVGWNWGKVDPTAPAFASVEGRLLLASLREIPEAIRERLAMVIGGPILTAEDWKRKLADYLPRLTAVWLQGRSSGSAEVWVLGSAALAKLGKGKFPLSKKVIDALQPLCSESFAGQAAAEAALKGVLGDKANMLKRVFEVMERRRQTQLQLSREDWQTLAGAWNLEPALEGQLAAQLGDEAALTRLLATACAPLLAQLGQQIDQQIALLQSDPWVDTELANREQHLLIKTLLLEGKIDETQWNDRAHPPAGVSTGVWQSFLEEHRRVRYSHMTHLGNLRKSITNDRNFIEFLKIHRARTRLELGRPEHIDFRAGGPANGLVSRRYGKPYDHVFMRLLTWKPSSREQGAWEVYIPGATFKGAFRKRASQILKTLWGESSRTAQVLDHLFGVQGQRGALLFSDAYLADPQNPQHIWCSMDGVKMDPRTGRPVETAKQDYLFAYGDQMVFQWRLDLQDIAEQDLEALSLLGHLLQDFQRGDIPVGGNKTNDFGWVVGRITELEWLTAGTGGLTPRLFGKQSLTQTGPWQRLHLEGAAAAQALRLDLPLPARGATATAPPRSRSGFISHRSFGGYAGSLVLEAEVLTPLHVKESGEPSAYLDLAEGRVNGWDAFAMAAPAAAARDPVKTYALPSRSLKGMLRHVYAIASDSAQVSTDLERLNPADRLFGWVGPGPNQSLMGRLSFGFARFEAPQLAWFAVPYPYTGWAFESGKWGYQSGRPVPRLLVGKHWRLFPHAPLAPNVVTMDDFRPSTVQASHFRALLPGSRARFTIRFWNLEEAELQRLLWSVILEPGLAHKLGQHRHLGFGSLRLKLLPESFLIDWAKRYAQQEWRLPIRLETWHKPTVIAHAAELRKALHAQSL